MSVRIPLVIDTDISDDLGGDPDDALALLLALASPEVELVGVTTVCGDASLRARAAARLLGMAGRPDVPVFAGEEPARAGRWTGQRGHGLLGVEYAGREATVRDAPASQWLVEESGRRGFHLVAVGPLSNVARALRLDPSFAGRLLGLTVMGGVFDQGRFPDWFAVVSERTGITAYEADANTGGDPQAALECARSGIPVTWVTAEVTYGAPLRPEAMDRLASKGGRLAEAIARMLGAFSAARPPLLPSGVAALLHDPLTLASTFGGDWLRLRDVRLEYAIERGSFRMREARDADGCPARVSIGADAQRFEEFCVGRVERFLERTDSLRRGAQL